MKAAVFIKCGIADTGYYLQAMVQSGLFKSIDVYRDAPALKLPTVTYHVNKFLKKGSLRFVERFLQAFLKKDKPDIYVGVYEVPHGIIACLLAKILKKKYILSIIGNPGNTEIRKGFHLSMMMRQMKYAVATTVTGQRSKKVVEDMGVCAKKVYVLPNSIPVESFKDHQRVDKPYDLISLGRISPEKNIDLIVKIVKQLNDKVRLNVAIAGRGPELSNISDLVREYNLKSQIEIKGFIPDEELEDFFNRGKIFIVSSNTEGFPRTILQAASCGALVISSAVGDIPEIINNGENGFLVEPFDNIDGYCNVILESINNPIISNRLSNRLKEEVGNSFSIESGAKTWKQIFQNIE